MSENIEQLIQHIMDQDFAKAGPSFQDIIGDKVADALEAQRELEARAMFNDGDDEEYDISDTDIEELLDDEDLDLDDEESNWDDDDDSEN